MTGSATHSSGERHGVVSIDLEVISIIECDKLHVVLISLEVITVPESEDVASTGLEAIATTKREEVHVALIALIVISITEREG